MSLGPTGARSVEKMLRSSATDRANVDHRPRDRPEKTEQSSQVKEMQRAEDQRLIAGLLDGDEAAFDTFADELLPRLYRYAMSRLGDRELAGEVTQATLCKTIGKLDTFRGESSLLTWLCACCRNEIAMHFRRQQRRPIESDFDLDSETLSADQGLWMTPGANVESALQRREESALVHRALDELPERYARALEWKYLRNQSVAEIAERLDVGLKAAESVLSRARVAFRKAYAGLIGG